MAAAVGTEVSLYVDLRELVAPHDLVVTQTGRAYVVTGVRTQVRGKHAGRQHLRAVVIDEAGRRKLEAKTTVHTIRWYKRAKGKR